MPRYAVDVIDDHSDEFVREIIVEASDEAEAIAKAQEEEIESWQSLADAVAIG